MVGGGNGEGQQQEAPPWTAARPSISIPACAWMESSGVSVSPGPMTLLSSLFGDTDECNKSFSELLAGAAMVEHGEAAPPSGLMFTTLPPHQVTNLNSFFSWLVHSSCHSLDSMDGLNNFSLLHL